MKWFREMGYGPPSSIGKLPIIKDGGVEREGRNPFPIKWCWLKKNSPLG